MTDNSLIDEKRCRKEFEAWHVIKIGKADCHCWAAWQAAWGNRQEEIGHLTTQLEAELKWRRDNDND